MKKLEAVDYDKLISILRTSTIEQKKGRCIVDILSSQLNSLPRLSRMFVCQLLKYRTDAEKFVMCAMVASFFKEKHYQDVKSMNEFYSLHLKNILDWSSELEPYLCSNTIEWYMTGHPIRFELFSKKQLTRAEIDEYVKFTTVSREIRSAIRNPKKIEKENNAIVNDFKNFLEEEKIREEKEKRIAIENKRKEERERKIKEQNEKKKRAISIQLMMVSRRRFPYLYDDTMIDGDYSSSSSQEHDLKFRSDLSDCTFSVIFETSGFCSENDFDRDSSFIASDNVVEEYYFHFENHEIDSYKKFDNNFLHDVSQLFFIRKDIIKNSFLEINRKSRGRIKLYLIGCYTMDFFNSNIHYIGLILVWDDYIDI